MHVYVEMASPWKSLGSVVRMPLLHFFASNGWLDLCTRIIYHHDALSQALDSNGDSALHHACASGNVELVAFLISEKGLSPSLADKDGCTPFHVAAILGHCDILSHIVQGCSPDLSCQSMSGDTALHYAVKNNHAEAVQALAHVCMAQEEVCIGRNSDGLSPLGLAIELGYTNIANAITELLFTNSLEMELENKAIAYLFNVAFRDYVSGDLYEILEEGKHSKEEQGISRYHFNFNQPWNPDVECVVSFIHVAAHRGWLFISKLLMSCFSCDPESFDSTGSTPVHYAAYGGHLFMVKFLISQHDCNPSLPNGEKQTPLHLASMQGHLSVIRYLLEECGCEVMVKDAQGGTALHCAASCGHLAVVEYLTANSHCNLLAENNKRQTPFHLACVNGNVSVIEYLVESCDCDPLSWNELGSTAFHHCIKERNQEMIKFFALQKKFHNVKDSDGSTPLALALSSGNNDSIFSVLEGIVVSCEESSLQPDESINYILKLSITKEVVEMGLMAKCGNVLGMKFKPLDGACVSFLHLSVLNDWYEVCKTLIVNFKCDPQQCENVFGWNCLHFAAIRGHLRLVQYLISDCRLSPDCCDADQCTPLLLACRYGHLPVVEYLVGSCDADIMAQDNSGYTALHLSCQNGHISVATYLIRTGKVDPASKAKNGRTPFEVITIITRNSYEFLKLFQRFEKCKGSYPVETYCKIFVCGNTEAGKSSLSAVLEKRAELVYIREARDVTGVKPFTVGIIPMTIHSHEIGNVVLYDLAGHPEYHSSHASVFGKLMITSPAVFLIVIDLTTSEHEIATQLYYWARFVSNTSRASFENSKILVVGSHADQFFSPDDLDKRICFIHSKISKALTPEAFSGFVALDCRKLMSDSLASFIHMLSQSCKSVVSCTARISYYCHVLYAFMREKIGKVAVTLERLSRDAQEENEPCLPSEVNVLRSNLVTLCDKGLILFLDNEDASSSWIVIDKEVLLHEVNGTLFAPSKFQEIATTTGIVTKSCLKRLFPYHNEMLIGFLTGLEFCHAIEQEAIKANFTNVESLSNDLLFFPAFVLEDLPEFLRQLEKWAWCMWCPDPLHFLTTFFMHRLILRVAFKFPLTKSSACMIIDSPEFHSLSRLCTIWKNGIYWEMPNGVKVVIQVSELYRCVLLVVYHDEPLYHLQCAHYRSVLIAEIRSIQEEFCHSVQVEEYLVYPSPNLLSSSIHDLNTFDLKVVAGKLVDLASGSKCEVKSSNGSLVVDFNSESILSCEPFRVLSSFVVHRLFSDNCSNQLVSSKDLAEIELSCGDILSLSSPSQPTYKELRDHLSDFSIFAGRNPTVSITYFNVTYTYTTFTI